MSDSPPLVIAGRFNGPDGSANGGYACGAFAGHVGPAFHGPLAVTLHTPPRLDTPLRSETRGRRAALWDGDELVATASPTAHRPSELPPLPLPVAEQAATGFTGRHGHPFPTCFVCGVERAEDDGLYLSPGPVPDHPDTVACPWQPDDSVADQNGRVRPEVLWSALDCPGGWTTDPVATPRVLSWMTADLLDAPLAGTTYVIIARLDHAEDRSTTNTSALYTVDGSLLARATTQWLAIETSGRIADMTAQGLDLPARS
ncbi:MAG TPA: hypothetical protein VGM75_35510 [Pseudonocardiaceae bacterium]